MVCYIKSFFDNFIVNFYLSKNVKFCRKLFVFCMERKCLDCKNVTKTTQNVTNTDNKSTNVDLKQFTKNVPFLLDSLVRKVSFIKKIIIIDLF